MHTDTSPDPRSLRAITYAAMSMLLAGCASTPSQPEAETTIIGAGRQVLHTQCNVCHELSEVARYQGSYDREQWRRVVLTMMSYGAAITQNDLNTLVDYLVETADALDQ